MLFLRIDSSVLKPTGILNMTQLSFDFDENNTPPLNVGNAENTDKKTVATCINDILCEDITPPLVIIPELLVTGESTMLCALAGAAKTFLAQYIAACVATGSDFMDTPINEAHPVLFIDSELSKYQIQQRFKLIYECLGIRPKPGFLKIVHKRSFKQGMPDLSTAEGFETLRPEVEGFKVIIMDNISSLYRTAEETVQNDWNFYNDTLDELRELDKSILVLHHTDKRSENYRGHSEIARAIDHVLIARKDKKVSTDIKTVINIVNTKNRHSADDGDMLKFEFGAIGNQDKFAFKKIN
jgi:hypothetical protein